MRGREYGTMTKFLRASAVSLAAAASLSAGNALADDSWTGESDADIAAQGWVPMYTDANPGQAMVMERWQLLVWDSANPPRPAVGSPYAVAGTRLLFGAFAGGFNAGDDLVKSRFSVDTDARDESADARGGQASR